MRQLQGCILANAQAGRDALYDRAFRSADERLRAAAVIVLLQIKRYDEAVAGFSIHRAAHEHKPFSARRERAIFHVAVHRGVDGSDAFRFTGLVEIHFGQHKAQRGRSASHNAFRFGPVFRLRGELVAGNNRPFFHGYTFARQQDIRHLNADGVLEHANASVSIG